MCSSSDPVASPSLQRGVVREYSRLLVPITVTKIETIFFYVHAQLMQLFVPCARLTSARELAIVIF